MKKPVASATQERDGSSGWRTPDREAVELRAYELWIERGSPIGSPEVDWLRAETELAETTHPATQSQAAA